ncbi:MAG: helix-turn-helix domain-containing protein [Peptococcaceae bacterium]|nr:helix-turn-helix domain-containing protein [Peptococcaceae bacterium]
MGYKSIGKRLQMAREEAGLSQEQLAARIGCSQSTLSNYEKGRRRLYLAQLEKIAEELQKPMEYFMQPLSDDAEGTGTKADRNCDPDAEALMAALARLSPAGRRLAVDFIIWLAQREEKIDA